MRPKTELPEPRVSFSSLSWLAISPKYYINMVRGDIKQEETESMLFGKALHCNVLRPKEFNEEFFPTDVTAPINSQQTKFCNHLLDAVDPVQAYELSYIGAKSKSQKAKEEEASKLHMTLLPYVTAVKAANGRTIIPQSMLQNINDCTDSILQHKAASKLLRYKDEYPEAEVEFEKEFCLPVKKLHDDQDLYIHGFIDHLVLHPKNYKMIVTELKTTSKPIGEYRESFAKWHVARQLAMYTIAAGKLHEKLGTDIPLDKVMPEWYVIVVQTTGLRETKVFKVTEDIIIDGMMEYKDLINRYMFHYKEGWDHPQEYYTNDGLEYL